jgi:hypothetical protein
MCSAMNLLKTYQDAQIRIAEATGANDALLHIHAGLAILLAARVITGRSLATPFPLLCVWIVEIANELLDYVTAGRLMPDTVADITNTVLWPTLLFIGLRIRQARSVAAVPGAETEASGQRTRDRTQSPEGVPASG